MKSWEIIADNLCKAGWTWGCVSRLIPKGGHSGLRTHHRGDGKRYIMWADEKLPAFLELESAIRRTVDSTPLLFLGRSQEKQLHQGQERLFRFT